MNLTFYKVLAQQGSSFCNRALLNFQAFGLCDKMVAGEMSRRSKGDLSFPFLITELSLH